MYACILMQLLVAWVISSKDVIVFGAVWALTAISHKAGSAQNSTLCPNDRILVTYSEKHKKEDLPKHSVMQRSTLLLIREQS